MQEVPAHPLPLWHLKIEEHICLEYWGWEAFNLLSGLATIPILRNAIRYLTDTEMGKVTGREEE